MIEKKLLKFKAEGRRIFKNIEITRTIYSNSERSEQFLVTEWSKIQKNCRHGWSQPQLVLQGGIELKKSCKQTIHENKNTISETFSPQYASSYFTIFSKTKSQSLDKNLSVREILEIDCEP